MRARIALGPKLQPLKMLILDVDGVMTDGGLYYSADGIELKRFNAQDGYGVVRARDHGLHIAIISGRGSTIVEARAQVLQIADVYLNAMDKVGAFREIQRKHGYREQEVGFIGDDLFDLPLLNIVGFSAAPRNAQPQVRRAVDYVTEVDGGHGAVREVIDLILAHQPRRSP
jgi:3-deoxy-D-manno-octulosonate 8-phosphate phosphatase (KDO 8-P phosphatase)